MSEDAKFITVSNIPSGFCDVDFQVIVFPPIIAHDQMVRNLGLSKTDVHGAGFVGIGSDGSVAAHGKSVSLGIGSSKSDTILLNRLFKTQAYWDSVYGEPQVD